MSGEKDARITRFPARKAKGALSVAEWATSRTGMRDKAQRIGEIKKEATKKITKPVAPGTRR